MIRTTLANYRLFEYERKLACREVQSLVGAQLSKDGSEIVGSHEWDRDRQGWAVNILVARSTYIRQVSLPGGDPIPTQQGLTEGRHLQLRQSQSRRQSTRFGVHGLHEYKGKFNPQMARALINGVAPNAGHLLDPFSGSGTSLIEGLRLGLDVAGIDRSPIATHIARLKVQAHLSVGGQVLLDDFIEVAGRVQAALKVGQDEGGWPAPQSLSSEAASYLANWFAPDGLSALFAGLSAVDRDRSLRADLARLALSGILREVSLQLPEDLRVRRRPLGFVTPQLAEPFGARADRFASTLEELSVHSNRSGLAQVELGSASDERLIGSLGRGSEVGRVIVTSPPYATALPYIDTDRLSLVALGLASPRELRSLESELVGSREWNKSEQTRWEAGVRENLAELPPLVMDLVNRILTANQRNGAGFRRAAVPALLYRYFAQMADCFRAWGSYLRAGEFAVLVVGRNRTGSKEQQFEIDTPELLGAIAERCGYNVIEVIPFEAWPRYGLHASNGVKGEDTLLLQRK